MTDESKIEPISASADGKRNAYSLTCEKMGQRMNYAACLWRQSVLAAPNIRTPADWAGCGQAARSGECTACKLRKEEEIAGKAIYFQDRSIVARSTSAREWVMPSLGKKSAAPAAPASTVHVLDALSSVGSLADAVTAAATSAPEHKPEAIKPSFASIQVLPGESPLEAMRRMRAQANSATKDSSQP